MVRLKRAYDAASRSDGYRVLVERLWPRGVKKEALALDAWIKEVAPSNELRTWYGHDPERWDEFRTRYLAELKAPAAVAALRELATRASNETVTLVFSTHDAELSNAVVLKEKIEKRAAGKVPRRRRKAVTARRGRPSTKAPRRSPE